MNRAYDILAMGRSLIDLYANEPGLPFPQIKSFAAYVGGCPTNISVGTRRLGLRSALLTAVGQDLVGDFVLNFLEQEGITTQFSPRKPGRRTSAVLLAMEAADRFPLVPYRDNNADLELTIDDVLAAPLAESRLLLLSGTGLSREPSRSATMFAAEQARLQGTKVFLDFDYRADYWHDPRAYGVAIRALLPLVDVAIGTSEEVSEALLGHHAANRAEPTTTSPLPQLTSLTGATLEALVMKRGKQSTFIYLPNEEIVEAATFPVEVVNLLGAGDAFASGFIYGYLKGWNWYQAARMGNACGALVVTRHGCANFMPFEAETLAFIEQYGGF